MLNAQWASAPELSARAVLIALADAHAELRRELAAMEQLQLGATPTAERWARARWTLSRASRQRRTCAEQAYPFALADAVGAERTRVLHLQAQEAAMRADSHAHIAHWTPERIGADWTGYCAASRLIRRGMTERVQAEQDILIPILTRLG